MMMMLNKILVVLFVLLCIPLTTNSQGLRITSAQQVVTGVIVSDAATFTSPVIMSSRQRWKAYLMLNSDELGTLRIEQSFESGCDASGFSGNWDYASEFAYTVKADGTGQGYEIILLGALCVRFTFENTSGSDTTVFRYYFAFADQKT